MRQTMVKCRKCGHEIVKLKRKWKHCVSIKCPQNNGTRGKCGYTIEECGKKDFAPCSGMWTHAVVCGCGCRNPTPYYSFIKRILYCLFGIKTQPS